MSRQTTSLRGVGKPDVTEIAAASGSAARTTSASAGVIFGRRCMRSQSASSIRPMLIGSAAHLKRVRADQRVGDVLLDVRVHPLDDGDDGDEKRHAHDDAEQREERAKLVRSDLGERGEEDVGESH